MSRIDQTFARLRAQGRKGFVAYITAGDPSLDQTLEFALALERAGTDVLELGVAFSDPLADGAVNQMAAQRALEGGATLSGLLTLIRRIRERSEMPLVLFTYLNPIYSYGFDRFVSDAAGAGADGMLILDLPPHEAAQNPELASGGSLARIQLIAPTTAADRIADIAGAGSGFIYCVSREGVTGAQTNLADNIGERVNEIRVHTQLPIAVGFGISTPDQARAVARSADAVVVGSAIVKQIAEFGDAPDAPARIEAFVRPLADAVHG
jgi:tryptophan synthase alpha chain